MIMIYLLGGLYRVLDWLLFLIGCVYFVAGKVDDFSFIYIVIFCVKIGSYPEDKNKCYKSRPKKKNDPREIRDDNDDQDQEDSKADFNDDTDSIHDELNEA